MAIDYLKKFQVTYYEMIFAFVVISAVALGIGYIDGILFDTYVKPDMQGVEDYKAVGKPYQSIMGGLVLWIALGLAGMRVVLGILAGAVIVPILFFTGGLWFVSTMIFHRTGFTDFFYYRLRGMKIPTELDWLNDVGLFKYISKGNVTSDDLYLSMGIGITLLLSMWFVAIHHYKKGTLKVLE